MDIERECLMRRFICLCFQVPDDEVTEISEATEATDATDISEASDQDNNKKASTRLPLHTLLVKTKRHVGVNTSDQTSFKCV